MTTGPAGPFRYGIDNHPGHGDQKSHGRKGGSPQDLLDNEDAIRATWNYEDGKTGLRATVTEIIHDRFSTEAQIKITDRDGNQVGRAIRTIKAAERREIHHDVLELDPGVQGQGFATRFNANAEESYRAHGIERVSLRANQDVGGYAWARAGYDFADVNGRANVMAHAREAHGSGSVRAEFDRLFGRNEFTPAEVAMVGHSPGAQTWPGKEIMLASTWEAVKEL